MEFGHFTAGKHDILEPNEVSLRHIEGCSPTCVKCCHALVECGFLQTVRDDKPQSKCAEDYGDDRDENHEVPRREASDGPAPIRAGKRCDCAQPPRNRWQSS
jgi:hypothetical protein